MTHRSSARRRGDRLRLGLIGAGWIVPAHLAALDRLGRTDLVGVASGRLASARATAEPRGVEAYDDIERMLDEQRPDAVYVAVPPSAAVAACLAVALRGIPFLTEKPLTAVDPDGPASVAAEVARKGLVAAVGYHLRALEPLPEVRQRLRDNPARLVTARWMDGTPAPAWWLRGAAGGGQVVEQATHFYDLARTLVGDATVVGAASYRDDPVVPEGADVVDATSAVLRFETGAVGSFANTRRLASHVVDISFASDGLLTTVRRTGTETGRFEVIFQDGRSTVTVAPGRDPYEHQAEVFLDAVEARDPSLVLSSYSDALETDRLTRAVVAATGHSG
ncbi:MAG: Gfo/Idh/MocA family oxidoreductase [Candidatus Limnocylindrales bacterium]